MEMTGSKEQTQGSSESKMKEGGGRDGCALQNSQNAIDNIENAKIILNSQMMKSKAVD